MSASYAQTKRVQNLHRGFGAFALDDAHLAFFQQQHDQFALHLVVFNH